jgi:hypothetical protein
VGEAFAFEAFAYTGLLEQVDSSLLEQAGAHTLFDVLAATRFDDNRLDALQVEKMRKQEAGWSGADDSDLCARFQRCVFGENPAILHSSCKAGRSN